MNRYLRFAAAALAAAIAVSAPAAAASSPAGTPGATWTQTWATATDHAQTVGPWSNMTLRIVAHTSIGGSQLRLHLSNEFATSTATFAHVSVARQLNQFQSVGTPTPVTFGGSDSVSLAAGAETVSDPVDLPTTPGERLLVSIYIPGTVSITSAPTHTYAGETEYNIVGSDATLVQHPSIHNTFAFTSYLDGIDVDADSAQTVVAAGDSITDLASITTDSDDRWTDYLGRRTPLAVVNAGISGNEVTASLGAAGGPSLQSRWQHDVLDVPGIRTVIDAEGINDLRAGVSASSLESAQASLVASAHTAGLGIVLTTITPCASASLCTSSFETQRQAYNTWVKSGSSGADAIADFDTSIANSAALAPLFDGGDHLHPDAAGMLAMAGAVDVSKL